MFGRARPWCGGMDRPFRRIGDDILEDEDAARFQDAKDFALETFLIRDAHLHLDGDGYPYIRDGDINHRQCRLCWKASGLLSHGQGFDWSV